MNHETNLIYSCTNCQELFVNEQDIQCHTEIVYLTESNQASQFECKICEEKFDGRENLKYHFKTHHTQSLRNHCSQYDKKVNDKDNLTKHIEVHQATSVKFNCQPDD